MTDTEILPPDPTKPGRYWLSHNGGPPDMWEWCVEGCGGVGGWMSGNSEGHPHDMAVWGYTLASPHPIPGPAALEAVWETLAALTSEQKWCEALPETDLFNQGRALGFEAAAAMLRAALETKEAP